MQCCWCWNILNHEKILSQVFPPSDQEKVVKYHLYLRLCPAFLSGWCQQPSCWSYVMYLCPQRPPHTPWDAPPLTPVPPPWHHVITCSDQGVHSAFKLTKRTYAICYLVLELQWLHEQRPLVYPPPGCHSNCQPSTKWGPKSTPPPRDMRPH